MATLLTIASAFLQRENKTVFITLLFAAFFLLSCILITRFGNLPIQNEMATWSAASLPANSTTLRDKWWSFHILRDSSRVDRLGARCVDKRSTQQMIFDLEQYNRFDIALLKIYNILSIKTHVPFYRFTPAELAFKGGSRTPLNSFSLIVSVNFGLLIDSPRL